MPKAIGKAINYLAKIINLCHTKFGDPIRKTVISRQFGLINLYSVYNTTKIDVIFYEKNSNSCPRIHVTHFIPNGSPNYRTFNCDEQYFEATNILIANKMIDLAIPVVRT
jgi:hypothetical protein